MTKMKPILPVLLCTLVLATCARKEERITNARGFIREWNYDRALTEIISLRDAKDPEIQYLIGYCYLRKNEHAEAAKYFTVSLATDTMFRDSVIRVYNMLSQNALKINAPERALFFYQELTKIVPEYEQASNLFLIGDLNYQGGNHASAVRAYARALQIDSTSQEAKSARQRMIRAMAATGDLRTALSMADADYRKLKTAANLLLLSEIEFELARKHFAAGALDSAEVYFGHIIASQEPKSLLDDAYYYTAEIHYARGNHDAALELYKKVIRLDPYQKGETTQKAKERISEIREKK